MYISVFIFTCDGSSKASQWAYKSGPMKLLPPKFAMTLKGNDNGWISCQHADHRKTLTTTSMCNKDIREGGGFAKKWE